MDKFNIKYTDIGAAALEDESAINAQNPLQILAGPKSRCAHGLDQISSCKQSDVDLLSFAGGSLDSAHDIVQLVVEVIQDFNSGHILLVQRLPWIDANPTRAVLYSDSRHINSVVRGSQASLLVGVADRAEEAANDFVVGLKLAEVGRLLEHAQMEVRGW